MLVMKSTTQYSGKELQLDTSKSNVNLYDSIGLRTENNIIKIKVFCLIYLEIDIFTRLLFFASGIGFPLFPKIHTYCIPQ